MVRHFSMLAVLLAILGSTASYGQEAIEAARRSDNLIQNPSFLDSPDPKEDGQKQATGYLLIVKKGSADIKGWTVNTDVELATGLDGKGRFLQLATRGSISQVLHTRPGQIYVVVFSMAVKDDPRKKAVTVTAGKTTKKFTLDAGDKLEARADEKLIFAASGPETPLELVSATEGHGPTIGPVAVVPFDAAADAARSEAERTVARYVAYLRAKDFKAAISLWAADYTHKSLTGETRSRDQMAEGLQAKTGPEILSPRWDYTYEDLTVTGTTEATVKMNVSYQYATQASNGERHQYGLRTLQVDRWVSTPEGWKLKASEDQSEERTVDGVRQADTK